MKATRKTQARTEIENLLRLSKHAFSHAEIQSQLNGLCDRVTIYRVLDRLVSEGIAHKIVNVDGVINFAACVTSCSHKNEHTHNHVHFSCNNCKQVTCLEDVHPTFQLPSSFVLSDYQFTISGLCPNCISI